MYILGRCSPDQDLLPINKSVPADFMESLLCHSGLFQIILILSGAYGDVFLLENVYIFSEMVVFHKICVSQMYRERAVALPLAGDLCRHMAWLERTVSALDRIKELNIDGVGMGGKIK